MISLGEFKVDLILPLVGLNFPKINILNFKVKVSSTRLECFKRNLSCVVCKRTGNIFKLELAVIDPLQIGADITPHLNLYHRNKKCNFDLLMTQDHILPKSKGGSNKIENLQTLCTECNAWKANKMLTISLNGEVSELVGLAEHEATKLILANGMRCRVQSKNGKTFISTMDWRTDRVNLSIENDLVTHASIG